MKTFIATAVLALAVQAAKEVDATVDVTAVHVDVDVEPSHDDHEHYEQGPVLVDYIDVDGDAIHKDRKVTEQVTVDELTIVDDPYTQGELVSVDGEFCE